MKGQKIYSNRYKTRIGIPRNYSTQTEKQIYRRFLTLIIVAVGILVVLFFWGLPILARLAGTLTFFPRPEDQKNSADVIPPFPPRLEDIPTATNSAQIKLTGSAESESTVEIFLNGNQVQKLVVDRTGKFEVKDFSLTYGANKLQLKATDKAGNTSPVTEHEIVFDNTPPSLEVTEPKNGAVFFGKGSNIKVTGKTEAGATVLVNDFWAIVDQDGNFSLSYPANAGENRLEVTAEDTAGNQTRTTLTIHYNP